MADQHGSPTAHRPYEAEPDCLGPEPSFVASGPALRPRGVCQVDVIWLTFRLQFYDDRTSETAHLQPGAAALRLATDLNICLRDPHSPWQRDTSENAAWLLRLYSPKVDLSVHSQAQLDAVARELNERPMKTLNYFSPAEKSDECIAAVD